MAGENWYETVLGADPASELDPDLLALRQEPPATARQDEGLLGGPDGLPDGLEAPERAIQPLPGGIGQQTPQQGQEAATAPPQASFGEWLEQQEIGQATRLNRAARQSAGQEPERAARVLRLQLQTGLPKGVIERNLDEIGRMAETQGFDAEAYLRDAPSMGDWLAEADNLTIAKTSLDGLKTIEQVARENQAFVDRTSAGGRFSENVRIGMINLRETMAAGIDRSLHAAERGRLFPSIPGSPLAILSDLSELALQDSDEYGRITDALGVRGARDIANDIRSAQVFERATIEQRPATMAMLEAETIPEAWEAFKIDPLGVLGDIGVTSGVQMSGGLAITVLTRNPYMGAAAMFGNSYLLESGLGVNEYLSGVGVDVSDPQAVMAALDDNSIREAAIQYADTRGVIVGAFDALSVISAGTSIIPKTFIKRALAREATETFAVQPTIQAGLGASGEGFAQLATTGELRWGEIFAEAIGETTTAPIEASVFAIDRFRNRGALNDTTRKAAIDEVRFKQGTSGSSMVETVIAQAQAMELGKLSPEKLGEAIAKIEADTGVENVYVSPTALQTYFQSKGVDPAQGYADLTGRAASEFTDASALESDVSIPLSRFARLAAADQNVVTLAQDAKIDPNHMTRREQQEYAANSQALIQEVNQAVASGVTTEDAAKPVYDDVMQQLTGIGFNDSQAHAQAVLYQAVFRRLAEREGLDPVALYKSQNLKIRRSTPQYHARRAALDPTLPLKLDSIRAGEVAAGLNAEDVKALTGLLVELGIDPAAMTNEEIRAQLEDVQRIVAVSDAKRMGAAVFDQAVSGIIGTNEQNTLFQGYRETDPKRAEESAPDQASLQAQQAAARFATEAALTPVAKRQIGATKVTDIQSAATAMSYLGISGVERLDALVTDAKGRPLAIIGNFKGTIDGASVYPRVLVGEAFGINGAANVWLAHNHPSGNPQLSMADEMLTRKIEEAFSGSKIKVKGMFAIAGAPSGTRQYSFVGDHGARASGETGIPSKSKTVQVVERILKSSGKLGPEINRPELAVSAARNIAGKEAGIIVLDAQHAPIAFVPWSADRAGTLRNTGALDDLYEALARANGAAAIIANPDATYDRQQLLNLAAGIQRGGMEIRVLDAIEYSSKGDGGVSVAASVTGLNIPSTFQQGTGRRGQIAFSPQTNAQGERFYTITLLENHDLSTFLHESGHLFLEIMADLAAAPNASAATVADWQATMKFLGVTDRSQIKRKHHEKWAEGFETYLFEGKAPSNELRTIFARFKGWMLGVYKELRAMRIKLNPQIRGVFDRLIASEEEIQTAAADNALFDLNFTAEDIGLSEPEFNVIKGAAIKARMTASERMTQRILSELRRGRTDAYKQAEKRMRDRVEAEVGQERVYRLLGALRASVDEGGVRMDRQATIEALGGAREALDTMPRGVTAAKDGDNPEIIAQLFGYSSADEMLAEIQRSPARKDRVDMLTQEYLKAEFPNMIDEGLIGEEAVQSVYNDDTGELLRAELKALRKAAGLVGRVRTAVERDSVSRRREALGRIPTLAQIRQAVTAKIAQIRIRDLSPISYQRAAAKAGQEAFKLAGQRNWDAAAEAKTRQLYNHEMYRHAVKVRDSAEKERKHVSSYLEDNKRDTLFRAGHDYLEQMNNLLARYEFTRISNKAIARRQSLRDWLESKEDDVDPFGVNPHVTGKDAALNKAEALIDPARANLAKMHKDAEMVNWRELTVEELHGVRENADLIWHLATMKDKLMNARDKRRLSEVAASLRKSIIENANRVVAQALESSLPQESIKRGYNQFLAMHRRLSSIAFEMDGGKDNGEAWNILVRPLNEAAERETTLLQEHGKKIAELYSVYSAVELSNMLGGKVYFDGIGQSLTKQGRLNVALNWGNDTNRQRLMDGEGWTEANVREVLNSLDKRDWKFVTSVWRYFDTLRPMIEENHKAIFGSPMKWVQPAVVETKFGIFEGGYFPIKFDSHRSAKASERALESSAPSILGLGDPSKRERRGFTRGRVEGKVTIPINLSVIDVIHGHVQEVLHSVAMDRALLDVGRIIKSEGVTDAIVKHYGMPAYKSIINMMVELKHGPVPARNVFEKGLIHIRNGTSIAGMAWSFFVAALQPLGLTNSIVRVGPKWIALGLSKQIGSAARMENIATMVLEKSEFMRNRRLSQNREINDIRNKFRKRGKAGWIENTYFFVIANSQFYGVDLATWVGAYEKSKAAGLDELTSIAVADQNVIDAQGAGGIKDLAEVQRGGPAIKLFSNFMSYMITTYNLGAARARTTRATPTDIAKLAADMLILFSAPVMMEHALRAMLTGDDDDDEDIIKKLAKAQASFLISPFLGLREFGGVIEGYNYKGPAGLSFFSQSAGAYQQIAQMENDEALWRALNRLAGVALHYPSTQVDRTVRGFVELTEGETENPLVLMFGPRRDEE